MNTIIVLAPPAVKHENMPHPSLLAAVSLLKQVKSWSLTAEKPKELPQKEYHENIERHKSEISFEKHSNRMDPEHSIITMHFLEQSVRKYKGCDEVKYACLKVSLEDNVESKTADGLVDYL